MTSNGANVQRLSPISSYKRSIRRRNAYKRLQKTPLYDIPETKAKGWINVATWFIRFIWDTLILSLCFLARILRPLTSLFLSVLLFMFIITFLLGVFYKSEYFTSLFNFLSFFSLVFKPVSLSFSLVKFLSCSTLGIACGDNWEYRTDVIGNATFASDMEVRNAYSVINNLKSPDDSPQKLVIDSINIHGVGDAALYMSNWNEKEAIADLFYSLASTSRQLGKDVTKLEVKGKATMVHIVNLYDQLRIKLDGCLKSEYTVDEVLDARDRLLDEVEAKLKELQSTIFLIQGTADESLNIAQQIGGHLTKEQGAMEKERIDKGVLWNWATLWRQQSKYLRQDLELTSTSLEIISHVKGRLVRLELHLEAFHESVIHARIENRRRTYMGLSVNDLLLSLSDSLGKSKDVIKDW